MKKSKSKKELIRQGSGMVEIVLFHDRGSMKKCSSEILSEPMGRKQTTMVIVKISMLINQGPYLLLITSFPGRKKDEIIQLRLKPNVTVAHRLWKKVVESSTLSWKNIEFFHREAKESKNTEEVDLAALQAYVNYFIRQQC